MKIQEATRRETLHIAAGTLAFAALLNAVFALLGWWDITVLCGSLFGSALAVLNFFLLGLAIQKLAAASDEKRARAAFQFSYSMRMLAMVAAAAVAVSLPAFHWAATVIPLLFPRLTIFAMQLLGFYKPDKGAAPQPSPDGGKLP